MLWIDAKLPFGDTTVSVFGVCVSVLPFSLVCMQTNSCVLARFDAKWRSEKKKRFENKFLEVARHLLRFDTDDRGPWKKKICRTTSTSTTTYYWLLFRGDWNWFGRCRRAVSGSLLLLFHICCCCCRSFSFALFHFPPCEKSHDVVLMCTHCFRLKYISGRWLEPKVRKTCKLKKKKNAKHQFDWKFGISFHFDRHRMTFFVHWWSEDWLNQHKNNNRLLVYASVNIIFVD